MLRARCRNLLFWLSVVAVALLVMVRPASADTIPVSSGWFPSWGGSTSFESVSALCAWDILLPSWPTTNNYTCINVVQGATTGSYKVHACPKAGGACSDTSRTSSLQTFCPVNYTKSGTPPNEICTSNVVCSAAGTLFSNGFYNIGTVPTGRMLNSACVTGCKIELVSGASPAASSVIGGTKYYFGQGKYNHTGQTCSPDTPNFLADFVGSLPSQTCAAGQQMISMSGVTKCFNSDGTASNLNSASAVAAADTLAAQKRAEQICSARLHRNTSFFPKSVCRKFSIFLNTKKHR